jgi:CDP-diacylglycerol--serine O-phosphatidyltransferase
MTAPHDPDATTPPKNRRRRRRHIRRERQRDFSTLLPHVLTTGNLAAGFYSITLSASGNLDRAALAIIFAGICDLLDGRVARMAGSTSRFGAEYDSIADTVSFGVAPAMLAFSAGALQELGWTGWVLAFIYTACAALRLARFNVQPERFTGRFEGLPSPAAAGMVLSSVWFGGFLRESGLALDIPAALAGLGVALVGLLMVSPIPYRTFKGVRLGGSYPTVVVTVIAFAVILSKPAVTLFIVGLLYVGSGPAEWFWRRRTGRVLEEAGTGESLPEQETRGTTP